jgi:NitT/TauT family transport system substrate-binding protein
MGYIPSVQFAPWYVGQKKGYFAAEGLKVNFTWGFEVDGVKLLGANQAQFALLSGDQLIQARAQGIPLVYVANYYSSYPVVVVSLKEKTIQTPKDLIGKKVGLPALWGASYIGWRALLYATGINEMDVKVQDVNFAQVAAVTQGVVDAAVGYTNNEPVQLQLLGKEINVIPVSDYSKLVSIGLVTNEKMISERPEVVQKMVRAMLRSVQDTLDNPKEAFDISLQNLPEAGGQNLKSSQGVFDATLTLWKNPRPGYVDPADWSASVKFMKDAGFVKEDVDLSKAYTTQFLPQ